MTRASNGLLSSLRLGTTHQRLRVPTLPHPGSGSPWAKINRMPPAVEMALGSEAVLIEGTHEAKCVKCSLFG